MPPSVRHVALPALWMLVASALFAAQAGLVKAALETLSAVEVVFFRSAFGALATLAYIGLRGHTLRTPHGGAQLALGVVGWVSLLCYFAALGMLPLGTATALNYTAPIFLTLFVALLGMHRPRVFAVAGVMVGLAGVWLLLKPSLGGQHWPGVSIALFSGVSGGVAYLLLSRLGIAGEPEWRTSLYFSAVGTVLGGIATLMFGTSVNTGREVALVASIGVLATLAQLAMAAAYSYGTPLIPATFSYAAVVFSSLIGTYFWHDHLDLPAWLAIGLVIASGIMVSVHRSGRSAEGGPNHVEPEQ